CRLFLFEICEIGIEGICGMEKVQSRIAALPPTLKLRRARKAAPTSMRNAYRFNVLNDSTVERQPSPTSLLPELLPSRGCERSPANCFLLFSTPCRSCKC